MTTWRREIKIAMKQVEDRWENIVASTISDEMLDMEFDDGYGRVEGIPFTLWTHKRVYFPVQYDGAECAGSVARHPNGQPTEHIGGG